MGVNVENMTNPFKKLNLLHKFSLPLIQERSNIKNIVNCQLLFANC
jgi:hypothetical protein